MRVVAVLSDYQGVALTAADWGEVRRKADVVVHREPFATDDELVSAVADADVICLMRERIPVTDQLLERLPNLKCVVTTGAANRAIDLAATERRGIVVSGTTNGLGRVATAELAWGLILTLARHIAREDAAIRAGHWQTTIGTALHGKTLGILGLGGVGRHIARYGRAFGMHVIAWSRNLDNERALEAQVDAVSWEDLLARSDVLSVNVVLSPATTDLIDAAALTQMKPTALLVNTSRGPIINEADLIDALRDRSIGGAALDVFNTEPLGEDSPLRHFDNVVLSPHLGYVTDDVYGDFYRETVHSVLAYLDGSPIRVLDAAGSESTVTRRRYEDIE